MVLASLLTSPGLGISSSDIFDGEEVIFYETGLDAFSLDLAQSVSGVGFTNSYRSINPGILNFKGSTSGSGPYTYQSDTDANYLVRIRISGEEFDATTTRSVEIKENVSASHAPVNLSLPGSFRSGPIRALWREDACARNYYGEAAMAADFSRAISLDKDLDAKLHYDSAYTDLVDDPSISLDDQDLDGELSMTMMNVNASFNGTGRIFAIADKEGFDDSRLLVDEDYRGAFSLSKKISLESGWSRWMGERGWLPCCNQGLSEMEPWTARSYGVAGSMSCICSPNSSISAPGAHIPHP